MRDEGVGPPVEREVDEELAFHIAMRVRELTARGWSEEAARAEALRRFGDIERVKSTCRDLGRRRDGRMRRKRWWDETTQDLRFAVRQFRRDWSFAGVAALTLTLAIGATVAAFSVAWGVAVQPLPYPDADRIVDVWMRYLPPSGFDIPKFDLSGPEALDLAEETGSLEAVAFYRGGTRSLTGGDAEPERLAVGRVSASLVRVLGVPPALGRWFEVEDDRTGASPTVVLGHGLWTERFGADPAIVGRSVELNGRATRVLGVMPRGFAFPDEARAWVPLGLDRSTEGTRGGHGVRVVARLRPDATLADLDSELTVSNARWAAAYEHNVAHFAWATSLKADLLGDAPRILRILLVAAGLVLLIACANVANLLLARGERRSFELTLRTALGAGRTRIVRQLVTESLVLSGGAALLGLLLAHGVTDALIAIDPRALPRLDEVRINGAVVAFAVGTGVLTALLFSVLPALALTRRRGITPGSGTRAIGSRGRSTLRDGLVVTEVGLGLVVVILAALVGRSLERLVRTDPGFDAERLMSFELTLPTARYPNDAQTPMVFARLTERLAAVPGVTAVALGDALPFGGAGNRWDFALDDRPPRGEGDLAWNARVSIVSTGFFETLGIPILEGRGFLPTDTPEGALVGVVSETMARTYWPGESAVGKRWGYERSDGDGTPYVNWITVVGVAREQYANRLDEETVPAVYLAHQQAARSGYYWPRGLSVVLRAREEPLALVPSVRAAMAEIDPDLPLADLRTLDDRLQASLAAPRLTSRVLGIFGALALLLAAVGIYGVVSYGVSGRIREIGVRVALGAGRARVTGMIVREGLGPVLLGALVGLVLAFWATRLVEGLLYGVAPTDPATFMLLPVALLGVGALACIVPALRATRVDPVEALREG
ncbi:MAG: ABC transporter permease [Gemmatimonadetes bacterium]|nr:ABC transporter permease [Gemmatimonadota bacterium]